MKIQINYNPKTNEIVGYSLDIDHLNTGDIIYSKVVTISDDEFSKLQDYGFDKKYDGELKFKEKQKSVDLKRQKELLKNLNDKKITNDERDELLTLLLNL
jgi:hypothetical protein